MLYVQDTLSIRAYHRRVINVTNTALFSLLLWCSFIQLLVVIHQDNSDGILFWLLLAGIIPALTAGVYLYIRQEKKYSYGRWVEENPEEEKVFMVVRALNLCYYILIITYAENVA